MVFTTLEEAEKTFKQAKFDVTLSYITVEEYRVIRDAYEAFIEAVK